MKQIAWRIAILDMLYLASLIALVVAVWFLLETVLQAWHPFLRSVVSILFASLYGTFMHGLIVRLVITFVRKGSKSGNK